MFPVPFKRTEFPVLGAYYVTINRAQGQTLLRAGLSLKMSVLSHGHLHVALGVVVTREFLRMLTRQSLQT